jgi:D-alanyl-D-alanine carboxypeptidase
MSVQRISIILLFNLSLWLGAGWWSAQPPVIAGEIDFSGPTYWADVQRWPASSTIIYSLDQGVLISQDSHRLRPIASLSKLVTALVILAEQPDWQALYTLKKEDQRHGNIAYIYPGETVTINDLWQASLLASDNTAIQALVRAVGLTDEQFRQRADQLAQQLLIGNDLRIEEPTGLSSNNQASALAMVQVIREALARPEIRQASLLDRYEIKTKQGRRQVVTNTDSFIRQAIPLPDGWQILGGKTGYIDQAGYCFAALWQNQAGQQVISVVLGSPSKDGRFHTTSDLLDYVTEKYY